MKPTYEELEQKCALQQSKLTAINELIGVVEKACDIAKVGIEELQSQNADLAVQLANAESKCRELAAESVTLNDKMNRLATWPGIEFYSSAWEFCNLDGNDALEFMCDVKTPATDAFLAEVRAQGVEMYADNLDSGADDAERDGFDDAVKFLRSEASGVRLFAAQLRKGGEA